MSTRLDQMIDTARDLDAEWDVERSERVREGTLRRRDVRVRRDRALRRGLFVAGGAGLLVLTLLRAASSSPAVSDRAEPIAVRSTGDAGYARD